MTEQFPAPLVPPEVNLQDFQFMPLDVVRLRDSDLAATEAPEACWAAVLLWCASWHQLPAASLPDDDRVLSNLSGYGRVVKEWQRVRAGALRGWIKCSDSRLYHPVVAEKAIEAWRGKLEQRWRTELARVKKYNQRNGTSHAVPEFEEWLSLGCPQGQAINVPGDKAPMSQGTTATCPPGQLALVPGETPSKGQGEGQGQGNKEPPVAPKGGRAAISFQTFMDECRASGQNAIIGYEPVWKYAEKVGLPSQFIELCWLEFKRRYRAGGSKAGKRYKDWRATFRNCVEDNWFGLWAARGEKEYVLTTAGITAQTATKEAA